MHSVITTAIYHGHPVDFQGGQIELQREPSGPTEASTQWPRKVITYLFSLITQYN